MRPRTAPAPPPPSEVPSSISTRSTASIFRSAPQPVPAPASRPATRVVEAKSADADGEEILRLHRLLESLETLPQVKLTALVPLDALLDDPDPLPVDVPVGLLETCATTLMVVPSASEGAPHALHLGPHSPRARRDRHPRP